jgi:NO-binding membrane sensor protein with MHYT domain
LKSKILLLLAILVTFVAAFMAITIVHAVDNSTGGLQEIWNKPLLPFFEALIPTIIIGAFTATLGYLQKTKPEDFDPLKLIATIIISALIGTITVVTGWDYTTAAEWFANAGLTVWVYWFLQIIAVKLQWHTASSEPPPTPTPSASK